ncbi:class I SAM-dependent methyltransferase [Amycolatopsis sp.]|uniref:class I SAM-dependent methyltransferase n=1 Tax=Amycolatopsis sp. TaxID=37632 RepID=UPI002E03F05E|nr:class I SAM-dependent methyltransferase [Amycolatopsis sp.]
MDEDRERLRRTFTEDAALYDRSRPGYPSRMFEDLVRVTDLGSSSRVLEIGCGTGQATVPLARLGCEVVAVELGAEMAAVARRNLVGFPRAEVVVSAFEDWVLPDAGFDAVLSATAFHWVDPAVRVVKAADALRVGGALAVVSTHHVAGGSEALFVEVQRCYERFDPATPPGLRLTPGADVPREAEEFERSGRFGDVRFFRYEWEQGYTTSEYLNLLSTYSGHRAMGADARLGLLGCIGDLIDRRYGGRIVKRYMTQLAVASRVA